MSQHHQDAPLSRLLAVTDVPPDGLDIEIVATPIERAELARLNDLTDVLSLVAKLRVQRWRGDGVDVSGDFSARLRQTCVVTLEDFEVEISEPVDVRFAPPRDETPASRRRRPTEEPSHETDAEDAPDPLIGGTVDLGAVVSEFMTLAIDPYPRKPGAAFSEPAPPDGDSGNVSPFSALRDKKP